MSRRNCRCWFNLPANPADDRITSQFIIHLICSDAELDHRLSRLLGLFAVDMPPTVGGYAHHRDGR